MKQRLEFLGDAVLDYMITSYFYSVYPNLDPGHLTDLRSLSVNNMMLADVSVRRSFHKFIVCDSGDLREAVSKYVKLKSLDSARCTEEKTYPKVVDYHILNSGSTVNFHCHNSVDLVFLFVILFYFFRS